MKNKLAKLINVKSIVTLIMTVVFAFLSAKETVSSDQFLTVFTRYCVLFRYAVSEKFQGG